MIKVALSKYYQILKEKWENGELSKDMDT